MIKRNDCLNITNNKGVTIPVINAATPSEFRKGLVRLVPGFMFAPLVRMNASYEERKFAEEVYCDGVIPETDIYKLYTITPIE